jgi:hypothetical protein
MLEAMDISFLKKNKKQKNSLSGDMSSLRPIMAVTKYAVFILLCDLFFHFVAVFWSH